MHHIIIDILGTKNKGILPPKPAISSFFQTIAGGRGRLTKAVGSGSLNFAKKRSEWQDLKEETLDALIETRDKAVADLEDECSELRNGFDAAQSARAGLLNLTSRRREFLRECDRVAGNLLAVYRDANRKARATPEPTYFQKPFGFSAEEEPVDPAPPSLEAAQQSSGLVEETVERIHRACQSAMDAIGDGRNSRA